MREVKKIVISCLILVLLSGLIQAQTLGATIKNGGVEFAIYSENATRIELWLFSDPNSGTPSKTVAMTRGSGNVWSTFVAGAGVGTYYGYRAWGPNWPYNTTWQPGTSIGFISDVDANGNRYNPNKLLLDPYARAISHDPKDGGYLKIGRAHV